MLVQCRRPQPCSAITIVKTAALNEKLREAAFLRNHWWVRVQKAPGDELGRYYPSKTDREESRIVAEPKKTKRLWELNKAHCFPSTRSFYFLFVSSGRYANARGPFQPWWRHRQSDWLEMKGRVMPLKQVLWQVFTSQEDKLQIWRLYTYLWGGGTYEKRYFRCLPLRNDELYPSACWGRASRVKEGNEETCRERRF